MRSIATATMASGAPPAIFWNWRRSLVSGDSISLIATKARVAALALRRLEKLRPGLLADQVAPAMGAARSLMSLRGSVVIAFASAPVRTGLMCSTPRRCPPES